MGYKEDLDNLIKLLEDAKYDLEDAKASIKQITDDIVSSYPKDAQDVARDICNVYVSKRTQYATEELSEYSKNAIWENIQSMLKQIPDLERLDESIELKWVSEEKINQFNKDLLDLDPTDESLDPDCSQVITNIQDSIKKEIEESISTQKWDGHLYPVEMVVNWTNYLKDINKKLDDYIKQLNELNLENVDRTWLRTQIQKFVDWINKKLQKIRERIVQGLKAMYKGATKAIQTIAGVIPTSISLDALVGWASNVISMFTKPYQVIITFIKDFITYTPPLVAEAGKVATKVVTTPSLINTKISQLQGEGSELVKEEIANAITGVTFKPPTLGELQG